MIVTTTAAACRRNRLAFGARLLALVAIACAPRASMAQDPAARPNCQSLAKVAVESVTRVGANGDAAPPRAYLELRDNIAVKVTDLAALRERERCLGGKKKVVLYIEGRPLPTVEPYPPVDPGTNTLRFELKREEGSRDAWAQLLGRPGFKDAPVEISVGVADDFPIESKVTLPLRAIPRGWFWTWTTLLVLLAAAFVMLARRSNLLRDPGPEPAPPAGAAAGAAPPRKPYSLAKMQAAVWFFLVLTAYLFIGLVAGDYSTSITGTVLVLMGISAATAVGSATIDAGAVAAAPDAPPKKGGVSRVWWLDILSDDNGVNFHRFQMAAWTAVLGLIFVHETYVALAMPTFDNTLLGLMGISSGTYLGLKTTSEKEKK